MRHVRMLGLCLVAALALGAYAVSSASALEWGKCELAGPGHNYAGPNCTKAEKASPKGTGEYEWRKASEVAEKRVAEEKPAGVPFSGHNVGSGGVLTTTLRSCPLETEPESHAYISHQLTRQACKEAGGKEEALLSKIYVECESESSTGTTEGKNKIGDVNVTFKGCKALGFSPCTGPGLASGEVKTNTLKGKLGWLNKSTKEVGVVLEPATKHGPFTQFSCLNGGQVWHVGVGNKKTGAEYVQGTNYPAGCYGAPSPEEPEAGCPAATPEEEKHGGYDQVISPITPVNAMTNEFTQVYTTLESYPYYNTPRSLENKHLSALEDFVEITHTGAVEDWTAAGEEITNVNTTEEEGEIKA